MSGITDEDYTEKAVLCNNWLLSDMLQLVADSRRSLGRTKRQAKTYRIPKLKHIGYQSLEFLKLVGHLLVEWSWPGIHSTNARLVNYADFQIIGDSNLA
jgi:hypothetical protein